MAKSFTYFNSWNIYSVPLILEINYSLENLEMVLLITQHNNSIFLLQKMFSFAMSWEIKNYNYKN